MDHQFDTIIEQLHRSEVVWESTGDAEMCRRVRLMLAHMRVLRHLHTTGRTEQYHAYFQRCSVTTEALRACFPSRENHVDADMRRIAFEAFRDIVIEAHQVLRRRVD